MLGYSVQLQIVCRLKRNKEPSPHPPPGSRPLRTRPTYTLHHISSSTAVNSFRHQVRPHMNHIPFAVFLAIFCVLFVLPLLMLSLLYCCCYPLGRPTTFFLKYVNRQTKEGRKEGEKEREREREREKKEERKRKRDRHACVWVGMYVGEERGVFPLASLQDKGGWGWLDGLRSMDSTSSDMAFLVCPAYTQFELTTAFPCHASHGTPYFFLSQCSASHSFSLPVYLYSLYFLCCCCCCCCCFGRLLYPSTSV